MKKGFWSTFVCVSLLIANVAIAKPNKLYFFGDSSTDSGNVPTAPFTNQKGDVWAQVLGKFYGMDITNSLSGGTNYAYAGATTSGNVPVPSVASQVDMILAQQNKLDANSFYFFFAGFNDIANAVDQFAGINAALSLTASVSRIIAHGAEYVIVSNLPDANIPYYTINMLDYNNVVKPLIDSFNQFLLLGLSGVNHDVIQADANGLANAILANPVLYGFDTNAPTTPCADNNSACSGKIFIQDGLHFTTQAHSTLADYYFSLLTAPYFYSTMSKVAASMANNQLRLINQKLIDIDRTAQGNHLFAIGSWLPRLSPAQSYRYDANNARSFILGLTRNVTDTVSFGGAFSYNAGKTDIANGLGHYDNAHNMLNLFMNFDDHTWFFSLLVNFGWLDYNSIERHLSIGAFNNYANGATTGHQYGLAANASYMVYSNDSIRTGPLAELYYQRLTINGYSELSNATYASLRFRDQKYNQTNGGLGWQLIHEGQWNDTQVTTNFFALYNRQWTPTNNRIVFNVITLPGSHGALNVANQTPSYASLGFNSKAKVREDVDVSLGYYAQPGSDHINQQAVTFAVSKHLT